MNFRQKKAANISVLGRGVNVTSQGERQLEDLSLLTVASMVIAMDEDHEVSDSDRSEEDTGLTAVPSLT